MMMIIVNIVIIVRPLSSEEQTTPPSRETRRARAAVPPGPHQALRAERQVLSLSLSLYIYIYICRSLGLVSDNIAQLSASPYKTGDVQVDLRAKVLEKSWKSRPLFRAPPPVSGLHI